MRSQERPTDTQIPERFMTADERAILVQPDFNVEADSRVSPPVFHRSVCEAREFLEPVLSYWLGTIFTFPRLPILMSSRAWASSAPFGSPTPLWGFAMRPMTTSVSWFLILTTA